MSNWNFKKKNGTALIIAIICVILLCMIMMYFIEKLLPVAKNIKGIENSTIAYYDALDGVENALLFLKTSNPGDESGVIYNTSNPKGFGYQITASGSAIPIVGEGNSEFDSKWNIIGPGKPIQLAIGSSINWGTVNITFRVPYGTQLNTSLNNVGIINWLISGNNSSGIGLTLYASGEANMVKGDNINSSNTINFTSTAFRNGIDLNGTKGLFSDFYNSTLIFNATGLGSNCDGNKCILKLSIVQPLIGSIGESIPYLEYKIDFGLNTVPLQYARIESDGYSYGFKRHIRRDVKQLTTSEALDFTVSQ